MTKKILKIREFEAQFDWKVALFVLIALCLLLNLGIWQLQRAEEKRYINAELELRQQAAPVTIERVLSTDRQAITGLKVSLQGAYVNNRSIVIANQFFRGQRGFEVLTPFQLSSSDQLVLVSRGWLATTPGKDNALQIPAVNGDQQLFAEVIIPLENSFFIAESLGTEHWPLHLHHFDFATVKGLFDRPLSPFMVRLDKDAPGVLVRHWRSKRLDPGTNTSYAMQWFGMALLLLIAVLIVSTNITKLLHTAFGR